MRNYLFLLFFYSLVAYSQENCNNGIDDDSDGKIDLNDPECICNTGSITSIIPNHSFEVHSSCPTLFSTPGDDQLSKATPWIQATNATSDFHHKCGYVGPGINSIGLNNFPDGDGLAAAIFLPDWKEYIGTPLLSPMLAGTNYQLTLSISFVCLEGQLFLYNLRDADDFEPINITLYGCTSGTNLPVNTEFSPNIADPTWFIIGHATYTPESIWSEITISFTPNVNINAIMIGAPEVLPNSYTLSNDYYSYFLYDNLLLSTASSFGVNIAQTGFFCDNNLVLSANLTSSFSGNQTYQWYLNGIAIVGATNSTYQVPAFATNIGQYSVKVTDGTNCYISSKVTVNNTIPSPSYTTIQPNCIVPTGMITITTPAAEYSFDNGATWQSSPTKNLLAIGTYFIKIKTPSGCISSSTGVNIIQPQLLSNGSYIVTQPTTCDDKGSITITSSIASEYSFDDGVTWSANATAIDLVPGIYYIKIKDASGCQSSSQMVYINQIYMNSPSYTKTQATCGTGGSITITTTALEYSFDDGVTWGTSNTATNLAPGYYLIRVRNLSCISYAEYVYIDPFYLNIVPAYTSIQPTCGVGGSITITTAATEYSFDGGITWSANNTMTNLLPGYYEIIVRNAVNCNSYSTNVALYYFYLPDPTYTVIQPTCSSGGEITITTLADDYSIDSGTTWQTSPTFTNLSPGTYYVKIRNSLGCESQLNYVNLNYTTLAAPLYVFSNPVCGNNGSITITSVASEYSFDGGNTWQTSPTLNNLGQGYYFLQIRNGVNCESYYINVYLEDFSSLYPQYTIIDADCGAYASITITSPADYYSFDGGITWSTTPTLSNLIGNANYPLMIRNGLTCVSNISNAFIYSNYYPIPLANNYSTTLCDSFNDGSENVDLTQFNSFLIANHTNYTFSYYNSFSGAENQNNANLISNFNSCNLSNSNNTVYVRVTSVNNCYKVVELQFTFIDSPVLIMDDTFPLCEFSSIILNAGSGFSSYLWSTNETTQTITITQPGDYWLMVTETHGSLICDSRKDFTVFMSNPATFANIETFDWTDTENAIVVNVTGLGDYEYSLDGIHYQDFNVFQGLPSGSYTVFVRDKHGCGVVDNEVFLLNYPKYFTPNTDNFNDFWRIKFSKNEPNLTIKIFDRMGKFIISMNSSAIGWDGKYNGMELPADDYWFVVVREDGRIHKGHFALKR